LPNCPGYVRRRWWAQLPGIREAAVVGVPDALLGETVWAFVIPEEGAAPGRSEILAHCRQGLEAHEVPDQVRIVEDWPRAESGKAQKHRLRQIAVPLDALQEGAAFIEDLQVDSLALASMMLRLEELGLSILLERAWEIETVGDAYKAYCESRPSSPNP